MKEGRARPAAGRRRARWREASPWQRTPPPHPAASPFAPPLPRSGPLCGAEREHGACAAASPAHGLENGGHGACAAASPAPCAENRGYGACAAAGPAPGLYKRARRRRPRQSPGRAAGTSRRAPAAPRSPHALARPLRAARRLSQLPRPREPPDGRHVALRALRRRWAPGRAGGRRLGRRGSACVMAALPFRGAADPARRPGLGRVGWARLGSARLGRVRSGRVGSSRAGPLRAARTPPRRPPSCRPVTHFRAAFPPPEAEVARAQSLG